MKRYKVTIVFEVEDQTGTTEQAIQEKGLEYVQDQIGLSFCDPDFIDLKCKLEESL